MTMLEPSGTTIGDLHIASRIVERTLRGEPFSMHVTLDGPRPQVYDDARLLRERFGWDVTVHPTIGYGKIGDVLLHTTSGGDRWMACPVCTELAEGHEIERGEVLRYLENPEEQKLAAMGVTGGFRSQKEQVLNWRFTFQPCGDTFIAYVSE